MGMLSQDFYIWTMAECIKDIYEWWGIDMMSMYEEIEEDFPNACRAIKRMYSRFEMLDYHKAKPLQFKNPQFVYEAISYLVPIHDKLSYDLRTKEQSKQFKALNMCSWNKFVQINRMDLLMAVLLFTEEFILQPITSKNVVLTDNRLTVYGNFVTFKVSKHQDKTYISIRIRKVMLLEYVILN
ncbi:MAG: hypothetical protein IKG14_04870 [Clostridia bacterium]|nr:hypothetical protein [Clostridia bacterium]